LPYYAFGIFDELYQNNITQQFYNDSQLIEISTFFIYSIPKVKKWLKVAYFVF